MPSKFAVLTETTLLELRRGQNPNPTNIINAKVCVYYLSMLCNLACLMGTAAIWDINISVKNILILYVCRVR